MIGDYRVDILGDDNQVHRNQAERKVGVSWGASVSGVKVQKQKPARVLGFQDFDEGDGALLKVDETDLNAIELADTSGVEINQGVVAIGYPAIIDSFTDPDLTPTFDSGNVSSIKTVADGLLSVFQLSAELSGGMSGGPTVDARRPRDRGEQRPLRRGAVQLRRPGGADQGAARQRRCGEHGLGNH